MRFAQLHAMNRLSAVEKRRSARYTKLALLLMIMTVAISLPKAAQTRVASPKGDQLKPEARELLLAINGVGNLCGVVTKTFLRGVDRATPAVYWSAACSNGANYKIRVTMDRVRITDCAQVNLDQAACFSPLTESTMKLDDKNTVFREATRPE